MDVVNAHLDEMLNELEKLLKGEKLSTENVLILTISLMTIIEKYPELTGEDKKRIIMATFEKYLEGKGEIGKVILSILPNFIDVAVALNKRELVIKNVKDVAKCCVRLFKK